jgi:hypothetical protein
MSSRAKYLEPLLANIEDPTVQGAKLFWAPYGMMEGKRPRYVGKDLKVRYRAISVVIHTDKNVDAVEAVKARCVAAFQKLSSAYDVLVDDAASAAEVRAESRRRARGASTGPKRGCAKRRRARSQSEDDGAPPPSRRRAGSREADGAPQYAESVILCDAP